MKDFLLALQFLTILPIKIKSEIRKKDYGRSLLYFPLVGLLIGVVLSLIAHLTGFLPSVVKSAVIVIGSIIITGGIHLDGFADTCDGFYGGKSKERILEIMRDSRIGVMGVAGTVSVLLLKFSLISGMPPDTVLKSLIMTAIFGRWAQVLACYTSGYARDEGKAKYYIDYATAREFLGGSLFTAVLSLFVLGLKGISFLILAAPPVFLFIGYVKRRISGMTGDTIGATSEVAETVALIILLLLNIGSANLSFADEERHYPERIISLAPTLTEELYYLGAEDKVVGVTTYCLKPPHAQEKAKIGSAVKIDIEKVVSLKPDLVVATTLASPQAMERLKGLGIKVLCFPSPESFYQISEQFLELGRLVGRKEEAEKILKEVKRRIDGVRQRTQNLAKKSVFVEIGAKPLFTVTKDSFINDCIEFAGGVNIVSDSQIGLYSREKVLKDNPDVIIISNMGITGEEERDSWGRYKTLKAVKNKNIYIMDSYKLCSPTPVSFAEALEEMAGILHRRETEAN